MTRVLYVLPGGDDGYSYPYCALEVLETLGYPMKSFNIQGSTLYSLYPLSKAEIEAAKGGYLGRLSLTHLTDLLESWRSSKEIKNFLTHYEGTSYLMGGLSLVRLADKIGLKVYNHHWDGDEAWLAALKILGVDEGDYAWKARGYVVLSKDAFTPFEGCLAIVRFESEGLEKVKFDD